MITRIHWRSWGGVPDTGLPIGWAAPVSDWWILTYWSGARDPTHILRDTSLVTTEPQRELLQLDFQLTVPQWELQEC